MATNPATQSKAAYEKALANKRKYNALPKQKLARAEQTKARRLMEKEGRVSKGDGTNVNHKKMLTSGGDSKRSNLEVTSEKNNKGWRKNNPEKYGKG